MEHERTNRAKKTQKRDGDRDERGKKKATKKIVYKLP